MRFDEINLTALRRVATAGARDPEFLVYRSAERLGILLDVCDAMATMPPSDEQHGVKVGLAVSLAQEWRYFLEAAGSPVRGLPKARGVGAVQ